ncbi:DUF3180 domain-containing protein [Actinocorallia longicatena]|uniref:DUF3180 domain-containing protein n=1 Tax=Actinocorallia longicatena TaxID=111803 RepID=A0ABP6QKL7_9ACTN
MKASRAPILAALVIVPALLVWALLRVSYSDLPPLPWTAVPTLLLLALGEIVTAAGLRNRIHHKTAAEKARPVDPLAVARMAVLGKASAHAAAVLAGIFGGFMLFLTGELDKSTPRHDFTVSTASAVAALILVGAGLYLEWCCRIPEDPGDRR